MGVVAVRFNEVGRLYHFDAAEYPDLQVGDFVIVETVRGRMLGEVMALVSPDEVQTEELKPVLRPATARDLILQQTWRAKEDEALAVCQEKASELEGFENVKFMKAIYNFDGGTLTFLYTVEQPGEERTNLKKLRQMLRKSFRTSVKLRQIGPRDAAKMLGGFGACGEARCCSTFLAEFCPISIRMAKVQSISLNPSEITGMCGRLRCCLSYENDLYTEYSRGMPKLRKWVQTPQGEGRVVDRNPLKGTVTVQIGEHRQEFPAEDVKPLSGQGPSG